jgi:hypothetical protein
MAKRIIQGKGGFIKMAITDIKITNRKNISPNFDMSWCYNMPEQIKIYSYNEFTWRMFYYMPNDVLIDEIDLINHEVMHSVLYKVAGYKIDCMLDNVDRTGHWLNINNFKDLIKWNEWNKNHIKNKESL